MGSGRPGIAEDDLLTVQQALCILPVGRSTLYQLVEEGQIPAIRVRTIGSRRGRILVVRAGLEEYVRNRLVDRRKPAPILDIDAIHRGVRRRLRRAQGAPDG